MSDNFVFSFGSYNGKTLKEVGSFNPRYVTWLAGYVSAFSLQPHILKEYEAIRENHRDCIEAAAAYVSKQKCKLCFGTCNDLEECKGTSLKTRNYHYHPYGKR